jgi:acyl-CoA synthetase (AMP-forming)/AMP-acid ligase II
MHLFDFLDKTAEAQPGALAVVHGEQVLTYGELASLSKKLANALNATSVAAGAKVATWMPNHALFFVCQFGIHRTHHVWMPLNPRATATEVSEVMAEFKAEWLFVHSAFKVHLALIRERVPSLKGIVAVDEAFDGLPSLLQWIAGGDDSCPDPEVAMTDFVTLLTTGGSTGRPKGVMRMSVNWATMIANYRLALPHDRPPVNLAVTPLTHVAGDVALSILAQGGTVVIIPSTDPQLILHSIQQYQITSLFLPPTIVYALLAQPNVREFDYSSLRYLMYGAAPMSLQKLDEAWQVFGPVMTQLYGLMEVTSTATIMRPSEHAASRSKMPTRLASCGRASPSVMIDIIDDKGDRVPPRTKGEVAIRGNTLMKGYDANPSATAEAVQNGWFRSGDVGFKDEQGYLYLVDRKKDLIISGGFNIFPGEVEQIIWTHPAVQDCAVIGVPDDKWGEAVTAVIELKPGMSVVEDDVISLCKERLGSIKAPKKVVVWKALPRSNVGKVLKKDIRAHYWKATGRAI